MRNLKKIFAVAVSFWALTSSAFAWYNPKDQAPKPNQQVKYREQCTTAKRQTQQDVNNIRATLTSGGDVWWNRSDGKYVVPKVEPGQTEVSSIFAGAVWLGGVDPGGNLKVACQQYGNSSNRSDFWTGPLSPDGGVTSKDVCDRWDRFFEVTREEIELHLQLFRAARDEGAEYTVDMIPDGVKGWPGKRNPYFFSLNQFDLPDTDQGLAGFWDEDGDTYYDPLKGDFPVIEIRGCEEDAQGNRLPPQYPDQMIFWIYNDEGGGAAHGESNGFTIRMEVQVQAFAYATNDQINDMTFQRYKLINRAAEDIDSTYFAMWVDADLGCSEDDYIGCDTSRSLAYTYNTDAEDGTTGTTCTVGSSNTPTYGTEIPIVGIDYFRGPLNEFRQELGMSSFTYINRAGSGQPPPSPGTTDPGTGVEFYRYLSGSWRDGTPFTAGGDAYNPGSNDFIKFAFVDDPNDAQGWSMCRPSPLPSLPAYDRRTVQASGPFLLQPGAVNELIIGAVWVPNLEYPCPDISRLKVADDIAQDLFDNCFDIVDGPDAPDVDWIELDREVIAVLTNSSSSNNYKEGYEEAGIGFPEGVDNTYNFEGYLIYQLAGPNVSTAEFDDPSKARLVFQVDVKNGINTMYNWVAVENPGKEIDPSAPEFVFYPEVKVEGLDQGIRHTFPINEDQFATGDRKLINHRKYYFSVKSYAHNNYEQFDPLTALGQKVTYLEGRRNIRTYAPIPRPIVDRKLNASYGDGPVITRIDGEGVGGNFLDISDETREAIFSGNFNGEIVYKPGKGPIDVRIFNPLDVLDGDFEVTFVDENMTNTKLDAKVYWQLRDLSGNDPAVLSDTTIASLNEQILGKYGFSIAIGQTADFGTWSNETTDGALGYEESYADPNKASWLSGVKDGLSVPSNPFSGIVFDYVRFKSKWQNRRHEILANIGPGYFTPYMVVDWEARPQQNESFYISPAWKQGNANLVNDEALLRQVRNVDIVFTPDKSKWSRCVVVETMINDYGLGTNEAGEPVTSQGGNVQFDLRDGNSVGKEDTNNDGLPDEDGDGKGMGWFPGYALDVETGDRLNIFFGENSAYSEANGFLDAYPDGKPNGADMMFNPTAEVLLSELNPFSPMHYYAGGQHFIYVTSEKYDSCAYLRSRFDPNENSLKKVNGLKRVIWAGFPLMRTNTKMLSYAEGLIPNELTVKLRVDNPYQVKVGTNEFNGYPTYRFKIEGKQAEPLDEVGVENALDMINVVPNPYYAFSQYEDSRVTNIVKITNLPAKCVVTIYSLDGKFIRQYNRDETPPAPIGSGISRPQVIPDLEWDLKNSKGIPVAGGVYLIHVAAPGLGERTLKWFGINRQFDPTGSN
jgi:hypothetical protein